MLASPSGPGQPTTSSNPCAAGSSQPWAPTRSTTVPPSSHRTEDTPETLIQQGINGEQGRSLRAVIRHDPSRRQLDGIASVASPLLAAGALTVIAVLVQEPSASRCTPGALALLAVSAVAQIVSVNASIWARYHDSDPVARTPSVAADEDVLDADFSLGESHYASFTWWVNVARRSYNIGLLALWAGLLLTLIPSSASSWRWVAMVAVVSAPILDILLVRMAPKAPPEPAYWAFANDDWRQTGAPE